jgi:hypothetical protein
VSGFLPSANQARAAHEHLEHLIQSEASTEQIARGEAALEASQLNFASAVVKHENRLVVVSIVFDTPIVQKFSWPWLRSALLEAWIKSLRDFVLGTDTAHYTFRYSTPLPMAPAAEFHFKCEPDEFLDEALARFQREARDFQAQLETLRRQSRSQNTKGSARANVVKYTEWFFRNKVKGESFESIARSIPYKKNKREVADAAMVGARVRNVATWLSLSYMTGRSDAPQP